MTRRFFLALLGTAPLAAAESWEQQPFPNWSKDVVDRLLTDSPWARPLSVAFEFQPPPKRLQSEFSDVRLPGSIGWPGGGQRFPGPGRGEGGNPSFRTEVYLTLRWSSALPIRQALALDRWGRDDLEGEQAVQFLSRQETDYVIEIFGLPVAMVPQGTQRLEEELKATAGVFSKGRQPIRATAVQVPEYGEHLAAELRFPRLEGLRAGDGTLEFAADAGPMKIENKFKLKAMVYRGRLEL